jgi:glyoxalase family protein
MVLVDYFWKWFYGPVSFWRIMEPKTLGLHHVTAITSDASSAVSFYTRVLGLRFVKKTVNFDDPSAYHLYFGDERGSPGTLITFFDWGRTLGYGHIGAGVTHNVSFTTRDKISLEKWKTWLLQNNVQAIGPFSRGSFDSIYFRDPDGLILEIATPGGGRGYSDTSHSELSLDFKGEVTSSEKRSTRIDRRSLEMKLQGLHHVTALTRESSRTQEFFSGILKMESVRENPRESSGSLQKIFGVDDGQPGSMISFVESPIATEGAVGIGTVHHVAFAVENDEALLAWRDRLLSRGVRVTPVMNRKYFKSIYFREPNWILLELATVPPGFGVDESIEALGQKLALPDWLEPKRKAIEASLEPIAPVGSYS